MVPSSSGLGHAVFIRRTGVRIPPELLLWDVSSIGRAPALQAGGYRFKSDTLHYIHSAVAQLVERGTVNALVRGSSPRDGANWIGMQDGQSRLTVNQLPSGFVGSNPTLSTSDCCAF